MNNKNLSRMKFFLGLAIIVLLFVNAVYYSFQLDLTRHQIYSLSSLTKEILRELDDTLVINYYVSAKAENIATYPENIRNFLDIYRRNGGSKVIVNVIDPTSLGRSAEYEIGLSQREGQFFDNTQISNFVYYSGIELLYKGRRLVLPFVDRLDSLEYDLTNRIWQLSVNEETALGLALETTPDGQSPFSMLDYALREKFTTKTLFSENGSIDPSVKAALVLGSNLTQEQSQTLERFILQGGRAIIGLSSYSIDANLSARELKDTALSQVLLSQGLRIEPFMVKDERQAIQLGLNNQRVSYPYWFRLSDRDINANSMLVAGSLPLLYAWGTALSWDENLSESITPLLWSSPQSQTSSGPVLMLNPNFLFGGTEETPPQSYTLAALISKEQEVGGLFQALVIGSSASFQNEVLQNAPDNLDFLFRALEWSLEKEHFISLKKNFVRSYLKFETPEALAASSTWLIIFNMILVPFFVLAIGIARYIVRRKTK